MEALRELVIPLELLEAEMFPYFDEFTKFSFAWTSKYFANPSINTSTSLPFFDLFMNACQNGYLNLLKFWYPGDNRPFSVEFPRAAAFYGHIDILRWFMEQQGVLDPSLLLHAVFNNQYFAAHFLIDNECPLNEETAIVTLYRLDWGDTLLRPTLMELSKSSGLVDSAFFTRNENHFLAVKKGAGKIIMTSDETYADFQANKHFLIVKALIEDRSIFIDSSVVRELVDQNKWRFVKMICDLQLSPLPINEDASVLRNKIETGIGLPPPQVLIDRSILSIAFSVSILFIIIYYIILYFVVFLEEVFVQVPFPVRAGARTPLAPWHRMQSASIYDYIGKVLSENSRADLLAWFTEHRFLDMIHLHFPTLFKKRSWPILRDVLLRAKAIVSNTEEIIDQAILYADRDMFIFLGENGFLNVWKKHHTELWAVYRTDDELEWLICEMEGVAKTADLAGGLLLSGYFKILQRLVPSVIRTAAVTDEQLHNKLLVFPNEASRWNSLFYCVEQKALPTRTLESSVFTNSVSIDNFLKIYEIGLQTWSSEKASQLVAASRWDILLAVAKLGWEIPKDLTEKAVSSGNFRVVELLLNLGLLEWKSGFTVSCAQRSFWNLVMFGLERCTHTKEEMDEIAKELIRGNKTDLLDILSQKYQFSFKDLNLSSESLFSFGRPEMILFLMQHGCVMDQRKVWSSLFTILSFSDGQSVSIEVICISLSPPPFPFPYFFIGV